MIEKELKLVTKHHYRTTWLAVGMAAFGIPFGVAFGASLGNMAFLGIGIPIGMVVGMAIGSNMDKKAFTLVELLVVIAILAILAGVTLTATVRGAKQSRDERRIQETYQ